MNTTSVSLLERLRQPGDAAAWNRFLELYTPLLFQCARRWGLQEQDAADLTQEVFMHLLRKLPEFTYDKSKSFRAWLRTVALNKWRETQRRAKTTAQYGDGGLDEVPDPTDVGEFEEAEYRRYLVGRALQLLEREFPALTWRAFQEYFMVGREPSAVAVELHLTIGSVYASKSRVLSRLRQTLQDLWD